MVIRHLLVSDEIILVFGHYLWRIFLIVNHFMVRENKNLPWVNLFLVLRQSKSPITTLTWAMKFCFSFLFFCFFFIFLIYYYCRYTYIFVTSPFFRVINVTCLNKAFHFHFTFSPRWCPSRMHVLSKEKKIAALQLWWHCWTNLLKIILTNINPYSNA